MNAIRIPTDYTPCERYMGHVIAVRGGFYAAFGPTRRLPGAPGHTRADVRRQIEAAAA